MNETQIKTIGIPRGLMAYRNGHLWKKFFENLGFNCIVSGRSSRQLLDAGIERAADETCLPFKIYLGHVMELLGKCDVIFVPRMGGFTSREKMCTRYESLPDLIYNIFRDEQIRILSVSYDWDTPVKESGVFLELGQKLERKRRDVKKAYAAAKKYQEQILKEREKRQEDLLNESHIKILMAGHPYVLHDAYMGRELERIFKNLGASVLFTDYVSREAAVKRSYHFSQNMPWLINREITGGILLNRSKVDGIVLVSAYPCGPDALVNDMLVRKIKDVPLLQLTLDAQNGTAGLETRIESFMDIIQYQKAGGYGNQH